MNTIDKILEEGIGKVSEAEYLGLINKARETLENKNLVKKNETEFFVVGDTHGNLEAARKPAERALGYKVPIVFLGDYVDRGEKQLENLAYVLSLKIDRPERVILLRGNHETESMNHRYGFYEVVNKRYSNSLYNKIVKLYKSMPVAAVFDDNYFLVHGGIPKGVTSLESIDKLNNDKEAYQELFWNDPSENINGYEPNIQRGGFHLYGKEAVEHFLKENRLKKIIRAHEVYQAGYRYYFGGKLLSIFSVSDYRGGNQGKYAHVKGTDIDLIDN